MAVAAATSLGYGPFSSPTFVKTLEDGMHCIVADETHIYDCFVFIIAVPGEPQKLMVQIINSTAVIVSWSHPSFTNGIIINYELCIGKKDEKVHIAIL